MAFTYFIFGLLCETFNTFLLIFYSTTLIIGLLKIYWLYHALRSCTNNWLFYSIIWWYKHMSTYITQYLINFLQNISNRHCIIHRQWISTSKSHLDTSRNLFLIRFDVGFFFAVLTTTTCTLYLYTLYLDLDMQKIWVLFFLIMFWLNASFVSIRKIMKQDS